ncbi:hypothetical protein KIN20_025040 [Parelaphostrongylus tenuis]|uniref:Uncharacterized protein n=1 Tax=Parelaphostrongylus tenuis TaxID=148309 RepID=A0AAD5QWD8_PARTN|nr:hypothetical protein KIN20_025040 [Parelaphostrongylus tenuis]
MRRKSSWSESPSRDSSSSGTTTLIRPHLPFQRVVRDVAREVLKKRYINKGRTSYLAFMV